MRSLRRDLQVTQDYVRISSMPRRMTHPQKPEISILRILENLSGILRRLKITSRQIAKDLHCSHRTVNNWRTSPQDPGREEWRVRLRAYILRSCKQQGLNLDDLLFDCETQQREKIFAEDRRRSEDAEKERHIEEQAKTVASQEEEGKEAEAPILIPSTPGKEVVKEVRVPVPCTQTHSRTLESLRQSVSRLRDNRYGSRGATLEGIVSRLGPNGFIDDREDSNFEFRKKVFQDLVNELLLKVGIKPDERGMYRLGPRGESTQAKNPAEEIFPELLLGV